MFRSICVATLIFGGGLAAAGTLAERWAKRVESADATYQTTVKKAEDTKSIVVRKATLERVRVLKSAISDATKAGDFTAATELQTRLEAAQADGGVRPKPKNLVKFGGHEYAMIEDKATWHIAKRRCEEMGGHLASIESPNEERFVLELCGTKGQSAWLGASDEEVEGKWSWVNGGLLTAEQMPRWHLTNEGDHHHHLCYWQGEFGDSAAGARLIYMCEWEL
ncbi:MAG: C-type lectin domain-containing protein [Planctomycetota bacterium]